MSAFAWSQATHILQQSLAVRVSNRPIDIHSHLVHTVYEFAVEGIQQFLLHHVLLTERRGVSLARRCVQHFVISKLSQTQQTGSQELYCTSELPLRTA